MGRAGVMQGVGVIAKAVKCSRLYELRYKTVNAAKLMVVLFLVSGIAKDHPIFPDFHQHNLKRIK